MHISAAKSAVMASPDASSVCTSAYVALMLQYQQHDLVSEHWLEVPSSPSVGHSVVNQVKNANRKGHSPHARYPYPFRPRSARTPMRASSTSSYTNTNDTGTQ